MLASPATVRPVPKTQPQAFRQSGARALCERRSQARTVVSRFAPEFRSSGQEPLDYLGSIMTRKSIATAGALALALLSRLQPAAAADSAGGTANPEFLHDPTGAIETYSDNGAIATTGAFFQSLGTNGRSCSTCHVASQAFGLSAAGVQAR